MPEPASPAPDLSVVIITLNEERHLGACLASLPAGAEVVVLDSGSTDQTCAIARAKGARVETRSFTDYAEQKNAACALATRSFILSLDADETLTPALSDAILRAIENPGDRVAWRLKRRLVFLGRELRFGKAVDHPIRLFKKGHAHFENGIHERLHVDGKIGGIREGELLHRSYDDISDYFARFNAYTSKIAAQHRARGRKKPGLLAHVLRPWWEFVSRYFLRLGFLDGYAGYCYALFSSTYTFVKYAKYRELLERPEDRTG